MRDLQSIIADNDDRRAARERDKEEAKRIADYNANPSAAREQAKKWATATRENVADFTLPNDVSAHLVRQLCIACVEYATCRALNDWPGVALWGDAVLALENETHIYPFPTNELAAVIHTARQAH